MKARILFFCLAMGSEIMVIGAQASGGLTRVPGPNEGGWIWRAEGEGFTQCTTPDGTNPASRLFFLLNSPSNATYVISNYSSSSFLHVAPTNLTTNLPGVYAGVRLEYFGGNLNIGDHTAEVSSQPLGPRSNLLTDVCLRVLPNNQAVLGLSTGYYIIATSQGDHVFSRNFDVWNKGSGMMAFRAFQDTAWNGEWGWIASGSSSGDHKNIQFNISTEGLGQGLHYACINVFYWDIDGGEASPDLDGNGMADAWEQRYFGTNFPTSDDSYDDCDLDGFLNIEEYQAGSGPVDPFSIPPGLSVDVFLFVDTQFILPISTDQPPQIVLDARAVANVIHDFIVGASVLYGSEPIHKDIKDTIILAKDSLSAMSAEDLAFLAEGTSYSIRAADIISHAADMKALAEGDRTKGASIFKVAKDIWDIVLDIIGKKGLHLVDGGLLTNAGTANTIIGYQFFIVTRVLELELSIANHAIGVIQTGMTLYNYALSLFGHTFFSSTEQAILNDYCINVDQGIYKSLLNIVRSQLGIDIFIPKEEYGVYDVTVDYPGLLFPEEKHWTIAADAKAVMDEGMKTLQIAAWTYTPDAQGKDLPLVSVEYYREGEWTSMQFPDGIWGQHGGIADADKLYGPKLTYSVEASLPADTRLPDEVRTIWQFPGDLGLSRTVTVFRSANLSWRSPLLAKNILTAVADSYWKVSIPITVSADRDTDNLQWYLNPLNTSNEPIHSISLASGQVRFTGLPGSLQKNQSKTAFIEMDIPLTTPTGSYTGILRLDALNASPTAMAVRVICLNPPAEAPILRVSNITAYAVSTTQIELSWMSYAGLLEGTTVERAMDGEPFIHIAALAPAAKPGTVSFSDAGLNPRTLYYYRLRTTNAWGDSEASEIVFARTKDVLPPPDPPSALDAVAVSYDRIKLGWIDNSSNEDGYVLERAQSPDFDTDRVIIALRSNRTSQSDSGLSHETTYYYRICSTNSTGASEYSNLASAKTWSGYYSWAAARFATSQLSDEMISGNEADPDSDSIPNWWEYIYALDPLFHDQKEWPKANQQDGYLTISFPCNKQTPGISLVPQSCGNLLDGNWSPVGVEELIRYDSNTFWMITVRDGAPLATSQMRYLGLFITRP